jgi:molybdopterin-containing oxidoreductase family iron-sulfur binding subunit
MIREKSEGIRAYQALEEVGVKPNVWYQVKVRNEDNSLLDQIQQVEEAHH